MQVKEMIYKFMVETNTINSPVKPLTEDILHYLNLAQLDVLDTIYRSDIMPNVSRALSKDKVDLLSALIVTVKGFPNLINATEPNVGFKNTLPANVIYREDDGAFALPLLSNYLYYVESKTKVSGTYLGLTAKSWVDNKWILKEETGNVITTYFNVPVLRNPHVYIQEGLNGISYIGVIVDTYTDLYNIELTYVRNPKRLNILTDDTTNTTTCELHQHYHNDVVNKAVEAFKTDLTNKTRE